MDPLLIAARALHFAATLSLGGIFAFACLVAPAAPGNRRLAWGSLAISVASGAVWLLVNASLMSGEPIAAAIGHGAVGTVLARTRFGEDWLLRAALAALLALCLIVRRRATEWLGLAAAAGLLATLALSGHGGATPGLAGTFHLAADMLHLLAAGAWLGALVPFALLLGAAQRVGGVEAARYVCTATERFSVLGIVCVGTLIATGIVNTCLLVGSVPALTGTAYGRLLLVKLALFAVMVAVAGVNRLRLMPELDDADRGTIRRLRRNALGEAGLGLVVLAVVGALGTLPPAAHGHPGMRFRLRSPAIAGRTRP